MFWSLGVIGVAGLVAPYIFNRENENGNRLWWFAEGFYLPIDFRDVGASLNECASPGRALFSEGIFTRSNRYFSGHSCDRIGNPDVIYTLSYDPWQRWEYYCAKQNGKVKVGRYANDFFEIDNIERMSNWENPEFSGVMCGELNSMIDNIAENKRIHIHCNRGRDRTGAAVAILIKLFSDDRLLPSDYANQLAECDYEKTASIHDEHRGHILRFLRRDFRRAGGSENFINRCDIDRVRLSAAAKNFIPF